MNQISPGHDQQWVRITEITTTRNAKLQIMKVIPIEEFVPKCVAWVRYVEKTRRPIQITKDGIVCAEVGTIEPPKRKTGSVR
jgi:hypothetical protein